MIGKKIARFLSGALAAVLMMPVVAFALDYNAIDVVRIKASICVPEDEGEVKYPAVTEVIEGSPAYISESMIYWEKYDNTEERWMPCYLSEFTSGKYRVTCQLRTDVTTDRISDKTELYVNDQKWTIEEDSFKDYYEEDGFGWAWYTSEVYEVTTDTNRHAVVLSEVDNGTVDISSARGYKGDLITMTITPAEGYVVESISVKDDNGDVALSGDDLNKSFVIGDSDIKINVTFKFVATTTYINQVEAEGVINEPTIGGKVITPVFEITKGLPADIPSTMIHWETYSNGEWKAYEEGIFNPGIYRVVCQLRTDSGNTYLLDPSVKLSINGKAWSVSDKYVVDKDDGFSWIWFSSEEFNLGGTSTPTDIPSTGNPTPAPTAAPELNVGDFINRCYSVALGREADDAGYNYWVESLTGGQACGAQVGYGFIFSQEYINKDRTNEEFVNDMYAMYFGREADSDGFNYWVDLLESGLTREDIMAGFANSEEFYNLCNKYGVVCGTYLVGVPNDVQGGVNCFVARMYKVCLNRLPDMGGQSGWVLKLMDGDVSGTTCAYGFVFSPEFIGKEPSNEDFVNYMYAAFFGREADEAGFNAWVDVLNDGGSYEDVFKGFSGSAEFANLCASYGIQA